MNRAAPLNQELPGGAPRSQRGVPWPRRSLGVTVGDDAVRIVAVQFTPEGWRVTAFGAAPLPAGAVVSGEVREARAVGTALAALRQSLGVRVGRVHATLQGPAVFARVLEMPRMPDRELRAALRWEVRDQLPLPPEQAVSDFCVVRRTSGGAPPTMQVLVAAAPHSQALAMVQALRLAHLEPRSIGLAPLAQWRAVRALGLVPAEAAAVFLELHTGRTEFALVAQDVPLLCRVLPAAASPEGQGQVLEQAANSLRFLRQPLVRSPLAGVFACGPGTSPPVAEERPQDGPAGRVDPRPQENLPTSHGRLGRVYRMLRPNDTRAAGPPRQGDGGTLLSELLGQQGSRVGVVAQQPQEEPGLPALATTLAAQVAARLQEEGTPSLEPTVFGGLPDLRRLPLAPRVADRAHAFSAAYLTALGLALREVAP